MTALELCELAALDPEAQKAAQSGLPLRTFIEQLARVGQVRAGVSALAQVLPKGEAIAWGLASVRTIEAAIIKPGGAAAAELIEQWLKEPNEERRRAARDLAGKVGLATPAGCLAMAVFYSGGSMAPPESPVSPEPAANICGKMVAGAMSLAVALDPVRAAEHLRGFLDRGMRLANERKIWEKEG